MYQHTGLQDVSMYFRALADGKRLLIVRYLARHEQVTVTELGLKLHLSQPLISWHLRRLRRAGIVNTRRAGRQVWCSLDRKRLQTFEQRVDRILGLDTMVAGDETERNLPPLESTKHT